MKYAIGIFFMLHGLVHLLYMGHSLNYFELEKGFVWPENSRLFKTVFSEHAQKKIAATLCVIAAVSFVLSGFYVITKHSWNYTGILIAVVSSTVLFIVFWDGNAGKLHTQGGIAILINLLIIVYAFTTQFL